MHRRIAALLCAVALGLAGAAAAASPAGAAVPDRWGFAFSEDPAPPVPYIPDITRQWGSWKLTNPGLWAIVEPLAVGHYRVRFPRTASHEGVAHVTAVSNGPRWCQVADTFPAGTEQLVDVRCFRHGGFPDNTRFAVMFSSSSGPLAPPAGAYAYLRADPGGGLLHSYNSTGAVNAVGQAGTGQYRVHLPGVGTGILDGHLQVTAQEPGLPRRCKVAEWFPSGAGYDAVILCFDGGGALADSGFFLTYHRERAVFGGLNPPDAFGYLWSPAPGAPTDFNSFGAPNQLIVSGVGQRLVIFESVGAAETHVQVTAFGANRDYCALQAVWQLVGPDVWVRNVICFDGVTGARADNDFFVSYTSRK